MINYNNISEIVDEIALDKPLDWESINYEEIKKLSILNMSEHYYNVVNDKTTNSTEKDQLIISIISYLMIENTLLWIDQERRVRHL